MGTPVGRTIALLVGLFALASVALPGDENLWWTVPAMPTRFYTGLPLSVLREVPAFWFYYLATIQ